MPLTVPIVVPLNTAAVAPANIVRHHLNKVKTSGEDEQMKERVTNIGQVEKVILFHTSPSSPSTLTFIGFSGIISDSATPSADVYSYQKVEKKRI